MQAETALDPIIYFKYLSGKNPDEKSLELYHNAVKIHALNFSDKENRLHKLSLRIPFLIPFIDGGLALAEPFSAYRKNIYIILCILETRPEFFPLLSSSMNKKTKQSFFSFFFSGVRSVFCGIFGILILKLA